MAVLIALYSLGILALPSGIQALDKIETETITQLDIIDKEDNKRVLVDDNVTSCMEINRKFEVSIKITGDFENLQARIYTEGRALSNLGNGVEVRIKSTSNSNVKCAADGTFQRERTYESWYNCSLTATVKSPTVTVCITDTDSPLKLCEVEFYSMKDLQDIERATLPITYTGTTEDNASVSQDIESNTAYNDNTQNNPSNTSILGWTANESNVTIYPSSDERQFNATRAFSRNKYSTTALTVIIVCCLVSFATAVISISIFINHWINVRKRNKSTKTKNTSPHLDAKRKFFYSAIEIPDASEASTVQICSSFKPKKKETLAYVEENEQNENSSAEPVVKQSYPESVDDNLKDCAIYDSMEMPEDKSSEVAMTENELYTSLKQP